MGSEDLSGELSDQERLLLVFGYLGPLALVSLVASRREHVKWHAKQGLLMSLFMVAFYVALRPIYLVLKRYAWGFFSELFWAAVGLIGLGLILAMLVCIVRALEGERFRIPLLGDLADRL